MTNWPVAAAAFCTIRPVATAAFFTAAPAAFSAFPAVLSADTAFFTIGDAFTALITALAAATGWATAYTVARTTVLAPSYTLAATFLTARTAALAFLTTGAIFFATAFTTFFTTGLDFTLFTTLRRPQPPWPQLAPIPAAVPARVGQVQRLVGGVGERVARRRVRVRGHLHRVGGGEVARRRRVPAGAHQVLAARPGQPTPTGSPAAPCMVPVVAVTLAPRVVGLRPRHPGPRRGELPEHVAVASASASAPPSRRPGAPIPARTLPDGSHV